MRIKLIRARSILTKSSLGFYTLNHYVGCFHACKYCYARIYAKKFYGIENWGEEIIVKENAPRLVSKEAKKGMCVWMSSMADPYQPIEAELQLTRQMVEILGRKGCKIDVLTKSPLVLRDLNLLKKYDATVGFTITSVRKTFWEPRALHQKPE